jgi:thiol-disulfide isomerase/thioredoxin
MQREGFLRAVVAAIGVSSCASPVRAGGAKPGPLCLPLNPARKNGVIPFELPVFGSDGKSMSSADLTGQAIWLNFFASWCGDCNVEMPDLLAVEASYRSAGLTLIGINVGETPQRIGEYRERFHIPYPILMDSQSRVFDRLVGTGHLPTHLFYNKSRSLTCAGIEGFRAKDMANEVAVALGN